MPGIRKTCLSAGINSGMSVRRESKVFSRMTAEICLRLIRRTDVWESAGECGSHLSGIPTRDIDTHGTSDRLAVDLRAHHEIND